MKASACRATAMTVLVAATALAVPAVSAQNPAAPDRTVGEGPFQRLILRTATLIDGTGAPPRGPVDIVVEGNRIVDIRNVGVPGAAIDESRRPQANAGDRVLELGGAYVLPGFVDLHGQLAGPETPAEYILKLWMGHGITTSSDPGSDNGIRWMLDHQARSQANEITAPRLYPSVSFGQGHDGSIATPQQARAWVAHGRTRDQVLRGPARHHGSGARRGPPTRTVLHDAPRPARRGVDERARLGAPRAHLDAALVRPARGAVHGSRHPGFPPRLQLQRRAASLRRSREALAAGGGAVHATLERGDG